MEKSYFHDGPQVISLTYCSLKNIWDDLRDMFQFLRFKRHKKHPQRTVTFSKIVKCVTRSDQIFTGTTRKVYIHIHHLREWFAEWFLLSLQTGKDLLQIRAAISNHCGYYKFVHSKKMCNKESAAHEMMLSVKDF